jgi:DNA-binding CsgD family transcriptional regulator/GAF domain-containing protein
MDRERRRRAKREIVSRCHRGLDPRTLLVETSRTIAGVVAWDRACWHTVDPATLLFTSMFAENLGDREPRLPVHEYEIDDVNKWAWLARRPWPVGLLGQATHGHPEASARFRELLRPRGIGDELRASLVADGRCWGCFGLYRDRGRPEFSEDEAAFVAEVDAAIAAGLRRALLLDATTAAGPASDGDGPGLLLFDRHGELVEANAAGAALLSRFPDDHAAAGQPVPHAVLAVAAIARRAAAGAGHEPPARTRARTLDGRWLVLHGTLLGDGPDARTAVVLEPARPAELAELIVLAYGLTPRERSVTRLVVQGRSTAQIAAALHLSPFTVQDHLKAIFEKVGVHSRRELVAAVFRDHYWPRVREHAPVGHDGWYAPSG